MATRTCFCKCCSTYFECYYDNESGIAIDDTDVGICHNCLQTEDPYLVAEIITNTIKQIYIITPEISYE